MASTTLELKSKPSTKKGAPKNLLLATAGETPNSPATPCEHPILFSAPMVRAILRDVDPKVMTRRVCKAYGEHIHNGKKLNEWDLSSGPFQLTEEDFPVWRWMGNKPARVGDWAQYIQTDVDDNVTYPITCPYGVVGDRLWVKETFLDYQTKVYTDKGMTVQPPHVIYRADGSTLLNGNKWKPSIFMSRVYSRITLDVTGVRAERLQDIREEDAKAEGIYLSRGHGGGYKYAPGEQEYDTAREAFRALWNSINLPPNPIEERGEDGKRRIVGYISYPWSAEDFDAKYPDVRAAREFRGKPLTVVPNPWVWAVSFKRAEVAQ